MQVRKRIEDGSVLQNYGSFVRECAAHLQNLVEKPSRTDYDVFCRTLSEKYSFVNVNIVSGTPYVSIIRVQN